MSDLISKEKLKDYLERNISFDGVEKKFAFFDIIDSIPSADIMECARAIKEYCEKHECERCDFSEHRVLKNTDNYICRVHYACPCGWGLPEGEKE